MKFKLSMASHLQNMKRCNDDTDCDDENCYMLPVNGKSAVSLFTDGKTK